MYLPRARRGLTLADLGSRLGRGDRRGYEVLTGERYPAEGSKVNWTSFLNGFVLGCISRGHGSPSLFQYNPGPAYLQ